MTNSQATRKLNKVFSGLNVCVRTWGFGYPVSVITGNDTELKEAARRLSVAGVEYSAGHWSIHVKQPEEV